MAKGTQNLKAVEKAPSQTRIQRLGTSLGGDRICSIFIIALPLAVEGESTDLRDIRSFSRVWSPVELSGQARCSGLGTPEICYSRVSFETNTIWDYNVTTELCELVLANNARYKEEILRHQFGNSSRLELDLMKENSPTQEDIIISGCRRGVTAADGRDSRSSVIHQCDRSFTSFRGPAGPKRVN
ncbi:hypothetical protein RRG08_012987 [Elysia crispata]|uniref:Uncharacterized protein n=1 Tax=Elysia crispata TaxID=231223 RepID=A0AAE1A003_9GAST|nr:hypothetical protein RRG08_012987 [Elysia crispata]